MLRPRIAGITVFSPSSLGTTPAKSTGCDGGQNFKQLFEGGRWNAETCISICRNDVITTAVRIVAKMEIGFLPVGILVVVVELMASGSSTKYTYGGGGSGWVEEKN